MTTKSFFEYLGIAHLERIHSQFFAWIFSADCNAIDCKQKDQLLQKVFQLGTNSHILHIETERNSIDILIQTDKDIVVVENKIKSSQHSNQLGRYKEFCDIEFPDKPKQFFFLTLIGEYTDDKNWKRISYSDIYEQLKSLQLKPDNNHTVILNEYLIFLQQLVSVVDDFKKAPHKYDMVFMDGKRKKEDKINDNYGGDANKKFIATNQLETILQKCFLGSLVDELKNHEAFITDTRGDALVDFPIKREIEYEGKHYTTIIQLQDDTIKFAFAIYGGGYVQSQKVWIDKVIPKMEQLSLENNCGYKKLNKPKSKAYVSLSKKTDGHYWHKNITELSNFVKAEIENGKSLTEQLIKLLKTD